METNAAATPPTPLQSLLLAKFPGDLPAAVTAWREEGASWRTIAHRLKDATGVSITGESARNWWGR